jgi:uncharacterized protein HemX
MNEGITYAIIFAVTILLLALIITGGVYYYHQLQINNFQKTILNLSDEQKCLHICGFEFDSYFESYKFCAEKCDRISERLSGGTK